MANALYIFMRDSVYSYASKISALLLGFIYFYLVANYLGPEQYGVFALLLDFLIVLSSLLGTSAIYEVLTVYVPKNPSRNLIIRLFRYGLLIGLVFCAAVIAFPNLIAQMVSGADEMLVRSISVVILLNIVSSLFVSSFNGLKMFGKMLKLSLIENILNVVFSLLAIYAFNAGIMGIVYAKIGSLLVTSSLGYRYLLQVKLSAPAVDFSALNKFFIISLLINLLKKLSVQSVIFFLTIFIDPVRVGFYYLMQKISVYLIETPLSSVANVLLPLSSENEENVPKLQKIISLSIKLYLIASLFFAAVLVVLGPVLVTFLFPKYIGGLDILPFFAIYLALGFDIPIGAFYRSIQRNDVLVYSNVCYLIVTLVAGFFLVPILGLSGILIVLILSRVAYILWLYVDIKRQKYHLTFIPKTADVKYVINVLLASLKAWK